MNPHGTRAVQKLIENLRSEELINSFVKILRPHIISLIKDINGNHIIQKFLSQIEGPQSVIVYETIIENTIEISTHKHGCCVLQKCIENAKENMKESMIDKIIACTFDLIVDQYGNYVVQYILSLGNLDYNKRIIMTLLNHIIYLSKQKYSSNVVEKVK